MSVDLVTIVTIGNRNVTACHVWALASGSRSRLPRCWGKGSEDRRGVAIHRGGGWFRELVTTQQRDSLAVVAANAAASTFICNAAGMKGAALGMWYTGMDGIRTRAALRVPSTPTSRVRKGDVRRWTSTVCVLHRRH